MNGTPAGGRKATAGYDIGYCKPPEHTRFKKGQSGNPRGRPPGSLSFSSLFEKVLGEQVAVVEKGRRRKMPNREIMVRQAIKQAILGDLRFFRLIFEAAKPIEQHVSVNKTDAKEWPGTLDFDDLSDEQLHGLIRALRIAVGREEGGEASA